MEPRFRPYRSLFWPIILIGVGIIWLLGNMGIIAPNSLSVLGSLWPLILIVIGLDLLFGRSSPLIGALIGLLAVAAIIVALVAGPALGLKVSSGGELKIDHYTEPLGTTTSLTLNLDTASQPVRIHGLAGAGNLFDATIAHFGQIDYKVSGGQDKTISLSQYSTGPNFSFDFGGSNQRWDVGLAPTVPTRLEINSGSGSINMQLASLKLTGLTLDSGSGSVSATLPESAQPYTVELNSGSGSVNITLPANTDVTLRTNSGSGSLDIHLPANTALRVEGMDTGSGSLNLPGGLNQLNGDNRQGTWESQGYSSAAHKILIQLTSRGSGSVNIR